MLMADEMVTIYCKTYDPKTRLDVWVPHRYMGSWYAKRAVSTKDKGLASASFLMVRIPTSDAVAAKVGDIVVRGIGLDTITGPAQLANYERFEIVAIVDNRRGVPHMRHWRIEGA